MIPINLGTVSILPILLLPGTALTQQPEAAPTDTRSANDLTDAAIRAAVANELVTDVVLMPTQLDVAVEDGIVTLTGTADNLLARERSAAIARTVRGVRSVIDLVRVPPRDDLTADELAAATKRALLRDPAADSYEIQVTASDDGTVTLTGTTQSWAECRLCANVCKGVAGVTDVDNRIDVRPESIRTDAELQTEIEERLHWDLLVHDGLIAVRVDEGHVGLSGTVGSASEAKRAERLAEVRGVRSVDRSELRVQTWADNDRLRPSEAAVRAPDEIEDAVAAALLQDPRVRRFQLLVDVDFDKVTLHGSVDNLKARRAAANTARNTVGVARVDNRIRVDSAEDRPADAIVADAREALERAAYLDAPAIDVTVKHGVLRLQGTVDTTFERGWADDVVAHVPGVVAVRNYLAVSDERFLAYDPYVDAYPLYTHRWFRYVPPVSFADDALLESDIRAQLRWSPFLDADSIKVDVNDGVAVLTGTVDDRPAKACATANAYDGGAVWVRNRLTIRDRKPTDSDGEAEGGGTL